MHWSTFRLEGCRNILLYRKTEEDFLRLYRTECLLGIKEHPSDVTSGLYICPRQRCNMTGLWQTYDPLLEELCGNSIYGTMLRYDRSFSQTLFKNPYCLLCNAPSPEYFEDGKCDHWHLLHDNHLVDLGSLFSLQIQHWNTGTEGLKCGQLEVIDTLMNVCRDLFCPFTTVPYYGNCKPSPFEFKDFFLLTNFKFSPRNDTSQIGDMFEVNNAEFVFGRLLEGTLKEQLYRATTHMYRKTNTSQLFFYTTLESLVHTSSFSSSMLRLVYIAKWGLNLTASVSVDGREYLFDVQLLENVQFHRLPSKDDHNTLFPWMRDDANTSAVSGPIFTHFGFVSSVIKDPNRYLIVEAAFPLNCSYISLRLDDFCYFPTLFADVKSYFPNVSPRLKDFIFSGTLYYRNDTLHHVLKLCAKDYTEKLGQYFDPYSRLCGSYPSTLTQILSLNITALSLICICITLCITIRRRIPRSEPEVMFVISLVTTFFAQTTFQFLSVAREQTFLCYVIGISVHYLWIAAVFSQTAYCTLISVNLQVIHVRTCSYKLFVALLYSHVSPMVLVAINVIYSQTDGDKRTRIGYGETFEMCHINNRLLRASLLALPILLAVVFSLSVFAYIVFKIETITGIFRRNVDKHRYPFLVTYVRLLVVTGATWSFGLINELVQSNVLQYIFIVLVGGQGVVLFLSFSCTLCRCKINTCSFRDMFKIICGHVDQSDTNTTEGTIQTADLN